MRISGNVSEPCGWRDIYGAFTTFIGPRLGAGVRPFGPEAGLNI